MRKTLALFCGVAVAAMAGAFTASAGPDQDELVIDGQTYVTETKSPEGHPIDTIYSGWRFRTDETQALQMDDFENPAFALVDQGRDIWNAAAGSSGQKAFTVKQMVKTSQYWSLFLTFMVGATAGLMVIGVIGLFGKDALTTRGGLAAADAAVVTGTAMGLFYALMNGLGRIIWGSVSDRLGRKNSIVLMSLLQGVMMIAFYFIGNLVSPAYQVPINTLFWSAFTAYTLGGLLIIVLIASALPAWHAYRINIIKTLAHG